MLIFMGTSMMMMIFLIAIKQWKIYFDSSNKSLRSIKNKYTHTNWQGHRNELILTNTFYSKMHMDVSAFENLVTLLHSDITVNKLQS